MCGINSKYLSACLSEAYVFSIFILVQCFPYHYFRGAVSVETRPYTETLVTQMAYIHTMHSNLFIFHILKMRNCFLNTTHLCFMCSFVEWGKCRGLIRCRAGWLPLCPRGFWECCNWRCGLYAARTGNPYCKYRTVSVSHLNINLSQIYQKILICKCTISPAWHKTTSLNRERHTQNHDWFCWIMV